MENRWIPLLPDVAQANKRFLLERHNPVNRRVVSGLLDPQKATSRHNVCRNPILSSLVSFVLSMDTPSFLTEDVLSVDTSPVTTWDAFKEPQQHKFPQHDQPIKWREFLGCGWDGQVFSVRFPQGARVLV
jgi:hypothetical protein